MTGIEGKRIKLDMVGMLEAVDENETRINESSNQHSGKSTIDCPVCGDIAIAHFHYGGMCCYSCKAFFRRVVNTCKVEIYGIISSIFIQTVHFFLSIPSDKLISGPH